MPSGDLALTEAELIEPQLYLFDIPDAAARLAGAIVGLQQSETGAPNLKFVSSIGKRALNLESTTRLPVHGQAIKS